MDEGQIRAAVESERLSLADFLDDLEETEWAVRSLCPDWTVREVVAHLTIPTRTSLLGMVVGMLKARGDFHRMTSRGARARAAACTPAQLTQQLRGSAGSARRMPGSGPMAPLIDVLVHGQDIARPLGRRRPMPAEPATAALALVAGVAFYGGPSAWPGSCSWPPTPATPWETDPSRCAGPPTTCSWRRPADPPGWPACPVTGSPAWPVASRRPWPGERRRSRPLVSRRGGVGPVVGRCRATGMACGR